MRNKGYSGNKLNEEDSLAVSLLILKARNTKHSH